MANEYLYGAYGHIGETVAQSAVQAGTTPVYIGTAPVNLVRGFGEAGIINAPIKITSLVDAQKKIGYSSDWGTFTLCEAVYAHFNNTLGNIGPIYVINVLDPSAGKHRKETATTKTLTFIGGRAEFASDKIILDTLTIAKNDSGNYVEDTDYAVDYNFTKGTVIITSLKDDAQLAGSLTASFSEVDDSEIADSDIIGGVTSSGEYSGLSAIALLYPEQFAVCNLIAAPGWSHSPAVYNAMLTACKKINGHWDAFVVADLPLVDSTAQAVDTITKAIAWKKANAFTGERSKVYWPQAVDNLGNVFHLSTLAVVELMRADFSHNSVPMETCGNKAIPVIKQYFGANANNRGFDQQTGKTSAMRRKENANDYRYFPDPDLAPIVTGEDTLAAWRQELPVLPDQRKARYMADYGLTAYAAEQLVSEKALAEYFEAACESTAAPKTLANLMLTEVFRLLPPESTAIPLAPAHLGRLADMVEQGDISAGVAKRAVAALWEQDQDPDAWVEAAGLRQLNDPALLRTYAEQAMAEHPDLVAGYYKGKANLAKALMGAAMGLSGGKANPALLQRLMDEALEKGREAGK